jgi:hypothetical protein
MENVLRPLPLHHDFIVVPIPNHTEVVDEVVHESYEDGMPAFLERELGRLYCSIFSSMPQFRIHGGAENASVYVARCGERVLSALLYRIEGARAVVSNQCFTLEDVEAQRFASYIFRRYPQLDAVSFCAVESRLQEQPYPMLLSRFGEDFVLKLPSTVEDYHAQLGKSTRNYVNRYLKKLYRTYPGFSFEACSGSEVREADVAAVFEMNRLRMTQRGMTYGFSEDYPARTTQLLGETGVLCLAKIDGVICAGTILYEVEGEYFLDVLSHKSEYNDVGLGTLCCYLSICECIRRSGKVYHFLWGHYDYKTRLGGVERTLSEVTLYRSRLSMLKRPVPVLRQAAKGHLLDVKRSIHEEMKRDGLFARVAGKLLGYCRRMRAGFS